MTTDTTERPAGRDLAHHQPPQAPAQSESGKMLSMIVEAARDPNIDAAKMEQMVNLTTRLQDRELQSEFNRSLNAAIMEMPVITRAGEIIIPANQSKGTPARKQGKFARFEDIDRVCRPILARYNLTIRFEIGNEESAITCRPILSHANGFTERGEAMRVPADTSGSKNAAQAVGSAVQYAKRYSYCAALNIVTEGVDDDGNMGRAFAELPYEREQLVRAEAQLANEQGQYQEWFDRQPPKDRAWLVGSGLHEQYGGRALPAPDKPEPPKPEAAKRPAGNERQPQGSQETKRAKAQTPREWADLVKGELGKCVDRDTLDTFWDGKRALLDRLATTDHALWQELDDAFRARGEAIDEGRLV